MSYRGYMIQARFEGSTRYVRISHQGRVIAQVDSVSDARAFIDARNEPKQSSSQS